MILVLVVNNSPQSLNKGFYVFIGYGHIHIKKLIYVCMLKAAEVFIIVKCLFSSYKLFKLKQILKKRKKKNSERFYLTLVHYKQYNILNIHI